MPACQRIARKRRTSALRGKEKGEKSNEKKRKKGPPAAFNFYIKRKESD